MPLLPRRTAAQKSSLRSPQDVYKRQAQVGEELLALVQVLAGEAGLVENIAPLLLFTLCHRLTASFASVGFDSGLCFLALSFYILLH